jgi:hypothetical protein
VLLLPYPSDGRSATLSLGFLVVTATKTLKWPHSPAVATWRRQHPSAGQQLPDRCGASTAAGRRPRRPDDLRHIGASTDAPGRHSSARAHLHVVGQPHRPLAQGPLAEEEQPGLALSSTATSALIGPRRAATRPYPADRQEGQSSRHRQLQASGHTRHRTRTRNTLGVHGEGGAGVKRLASGTPLPPRLISPHHPITPSPRLSLRGLAVSGHVDREVGALDT